MVHVRVIASAKEMSVVCDLSLLALKSIRMVFIIHDNHLLLLTAALGAGL
jgi:hypothetical protein